MFTEFILVVKYCLFTGNTAVKADAQILFFLKVTFSGENRNLKNKKVDGILG